MADPRTTVRRDDARRRYELVIDDVVAGVATFHPDGDHTIVLPHTEIDPARRGQGLGALMVRCVLDDLTSRGASVRPDCSFVAEFIDGHPEYRHLLAD
jgi:predicted GNAT family acetyltransferase